MNKPTMREVLRPPYDRFELVWYYKHSQAHLSGNRWRCGLIWKEGPYATHLDGDSPVHLRLAMEAVVNYEFPNGKPRVQSVEEKAHFLQMLAERGLTCQ